MIYAIGAFDGFHTGHRALLEKAREAGEACGGKWGVLTFDKNPQQLFDGEAFRQLFTEQERDFCARLLGIPALVRIAFTEEFSRLSPKAFLDLLKNKYNAAGIVVGENFRFGADRAGDVHCIERYCRENGMIFAAVKMVSCGERNISSTVIRNLLAAGNVKAAAEAFGFPWFVSGIVERGEQRGRKLGFPTANLSPDSCKLYPENGSYFTAALVSGRMYPSVTNIGYNPTFDGRKLVCETHIADFSGDLYGRRITVFFLDRNRDEMKFETVSALCGQLKLDVENAAAKAGDYILKNEDIIALIKAADFDRD